MSANTNQGANNLISEESFSKAVASFQKFAGIPETGVADEQTLRLMQLPRCGNADQINRYNGSSRFARQTNLLKSVLKRRKRYALQGSKWRRQELTYRISQYPTRFNGKRHEVDAQIEKAFGIWSQVAPINFVVKRDGRVHIDIRFASGDHGDGDAFDGPGNTLAHAYFPQYGGDAHFDDQEYWTIDSYAGTNIFQVAAHELGHSLGLGHSNVREALMAPFYQKYKPNFKLHIDDVLAIQALYGDKPFLPEVPPPTTVFSQSPTSTPASTTTTTTSTSTTTTTASPSSFRPSTRQAPRRLKPSFFGAAPKHKPDPRDSNEVDANGIPDISGTANKDAAQPETGAGSSDSTTVSPSPTSSDLYPSNDGNPFNQPPDLCLDSTLDAITRTEDGNSYVFKGDFYWLLTSEGLAKGYPRRIGLDWDGLPGSLDAALTWADGKTFFFKGNKYWRFRNRRRDVGYPKLISSGFAGIPDDIDAAFVWSGNGRTYIFKGAEYWRFDSKADPPVSSEYPRSIKVWNGVPAHLNAAFKWENNVTYFFKGSQYYRFNDKDFKIESRGRPPFPRLSSEWWFGCVTSNLAQRALSSSLREFEGSQPELNQEVDWSYYPGHDEGTRILGTHISDHKPPNIPLGSTNSSEPTFSTSGNIPISDTSQVYPVGQHRIGLFSPPATKVSSSAISQTPYNLTLLVTPLLVLFISSFTKQLDILRYHNTISLRSVTVF